MRYIKNVLPVNISFPKTETFQHFTEVTNSAMKHWINILFVLCINFLVNSMSLKKIKIYIMTTISLDVFRPLDTVMIRCI